MAIITETNVTQNGPAKASIKNFILTNYSCREDLNKRGGGGGGAAIYVRTSVPCVRGDNQITTVKGQMELCSAKLFLNYSYE